MLLRPILLHVVRYSEYISDRDTEPSGFTSKCAFNLWKDQKGDSDSQTNKKKLLANTHFCFSYILPLQSKFLPIKFHNTSWWLIGLN